MDTDLITILIKQLILEEQVKNIKPIIAEKMLK